MVATETRLPPLDDNINSILRVNSAEIRRNSPYNDENNETPEHVVFINNQNDNYVDLFLQRLMSKAAQPSLFTKEETRRFRMDLRQSLYTDLLQSGYNKSFQEIYNLERDYMEMATSQGIKEKPWTDGEFQMICNRMKDVESNERAGNLSECYEIVKSLTSEFNKAHQMFVNEHFLTQSFHYASLVGKSDDQRVLADAHRNLGYNYFNREKYELAYHHFHMYMNIIDEASWKYNGGDNVNFYYDACDSLRLLYTKLGELCNNPEETLENYQMAHSYAGLCDNPQLIKQVSHKLALVYEKLGKPAQSVEQLDKFFSIAQQLNDYTDIDSASEVFAKVYEKIESNHDVNETLSILEKYVEQTDNLDENYGTVCSCVGAIYATKNDYETAQNFLKLSYEAAMAKKSKEALDESKIQVAIASAHQMLPHLLELVHDNSQSSVNNILSWKHNRVNNIVVKDTTCS